MNIKNILRTSERFVGNNSPAILTGIGVAGTVATAVLTGKASVRAHEILREEPVTTPQDKVKLVWKEFVPPVLVGSVTITSIVFANRIGTRRAAALAAAYSVSEKAFSEYKEKVVEKIGEKKEQVIKDEVAQKQVLDKPQKTSDVIVVGDNEILVYEPLNDRYFKSTMERLMQAQNKVNHERLNQNYISLNDFYNAAGLKTTGMGEQLGWNLDHALELDFSTVLTEDNRPCLVMGYVFPPIPDYYRFRG